MRRPPLWLWAIVIATGLGVAFADLRAEWQAHDRAELAALRARVAAAEATCWITRSPRVMAEVWR